MSVPSGTLCTMEYFLLLLLVLLFLTPTFFAVRKQRQRQAEIRSFQDSVVIGERVVTAGGLMGEVVALREDEVDLAIAANVVVTFDRAGILRRANNVNSSDSANNASDSSESATNGEAAGERGGAE